MSKPVTEQMAVVVDVSVTGRPELAVGATVSGDASRVWLAGLTKVIVWATWLTVKVRVMEVAAL